MLSEDLVPPNDNVPVSLPKYEYVEIKMYKMQFFNREIWTSHSERRPQISEHCGAQAEEIRRRKQKEVGRGETSGSHEVDYEDDSSGVLRLLVYQKFTDVSEMLTVSIIRAIPEDISFRLEKTAS
jgi:hypothetical protein